MNGVNGVTCAFSLSMTLCLEDDGRCYGFCKRIYQQKHFTCKGYHCGEYYTRHANLCTECCPRNQVIRFIKMLNFIRDDMLNMGNITINNNVK